MVLLATLSPLWLSLALISLPLFPIPPFTILLAPPFSLRVFFALIEYCLKLQQCPRLISVGTYVAMFPLYYFYIWNKRWHITTQKIIVKKLEWNWARHNYQTVYGLCVMETAISCLIWWGSDKPLGFDQVSSPHTHTHIHPPIYPTPINTHPNTRTHSRHPYKIV